MMPEYINREAARNELYEADAITMRGVEILNNFPAADVVEVVRCYECIHHDEDRPFHYCRRWGRDCPNDCEFYCAFGKRKDGGKDE